jgi:hypothetical protein
VTFATPLTLAAVAITNFSSFLLGGITENLAGMLTLQTLMNYSLSDMADGEQKKKSLMLVKRLFSVLHKEISRSNIGAALICGSTTFAAGIIPALAYLMLPKPLDLIVSLSIVVAVVGVFLVRIQIKKDKGSLERDAVTDRSHSNSRRCCLTDYWKHHLDETFA